MPTINIHDVYTTVTADISFGTSEGNTVDIDFVLSDPNENAYKDPVQFIVRIQNEDPSLEGGRSIQFESEMFRRVSTIDNEKSVQIKSFRPKTGSTETEDSTLYDHYLENLNTGMYFTLTDDKPLTLSLEFGSDLITELHLKLVITKMNKSINNGLTKFIYNNKTSIESNQLTNMMFTPMKTIESILLESESFIRNSGNRFTGQQNEDFIPDIFYGNHIGKTTGSITCKSNNFTTHDMSGIDLSGIHVYFNDGSTLISESNDCVIIYDVHESQTSKISTYAGVINMYYQSGTSNEDKMFNIIGSVNTYIKGSVLKEIDSSFDDDLSDEKYYTFIIGKIGQSFKSDGINSVEKMNEFKNDISENTTYTENVKGVIDYNDDSHTLKLRSVTRNKLNYKVEPNMSYGLLMNEDEFKDTGKVDQYTNNIVTYTTINMTLLGNFSNVDDTDDTKGIYFDVSNVYIGNSGTKINKAEIIRRNYDLLFPPSIYLKGQLLPNLNGMVLSQVVGDNFKYYLSAQFKVQNTDFGNSISGALTNEFRVMLMSTFNTNGVNMNTIEPISYLYDMYKRTDSDNPDKGIIEIADSGDYLSSNKINDYARAQMTSGIAEEPSLTVNETLALNMIMSEFNNLEMYRSGQITLIQNDIADAKLGDYGSTIDTGLANNVNVNQTVTETPGMHMGIYYTYDIYDLATGKIEDENVIFNNSVHNTTKYDEFMKDIKHFSIKCYDQNLQVGDGTSNSIQLEQNVDINNTVLKHVFDNGSKTTKYAYGNYIENVDIVYDADGVKLYPLETLTNDDNIGLQKSNIDMTGLIAFTNINVPFEKHNGVTVTFHNTLLNMIDISYTGTNDYHTSAYGITNLKANIILCAKTTNDILGKVGVDLTDPISINYVINSETNVTDNEFIISRRSLDLWTHERDASNNVIPDTEYSDFNVTINETVLQKDIHVNLIADMFRSETTTLVAPVVVINRVEHVDYMKEDILKNATETVGLNEDITRNYISVHRIRYDASFSYIGEERNHINDANQIPSSNFDLSGTLREMFYPVSEGTDSYTGETSFSSNMYTILRSNPTRIIDVNSIAGSGVYDSSFSLTFSYVPKEQCGHEGVFVETVYVLTSMLGSILLDGVYNLDNAFWYLSDETNGTYVNVPKTIFNPNSGNDYIRAKSYRKCISSILYETTPSEVPLFVDYYKNVEIPPKWMEKDEVYDGYYAVEILRYYNDSLSTYVRTATGKRPRLPIVYEDTGINIGFTDINYHNEPELQYKNVSKSFVKLFLGDEYDTLLYESDSRVFFEVNENASEYKENFIDLITLAYRDASANGYERNGQINSLFKELTDSTVGTWMNAGSTNKIYEIKIKVKDVEYPLHRYTILLVESLYLLSRFGTPMIKERAVDIAAIGSSYDLYFDINTTRVIGSSVHNLKNRYERIPYTIELSSRRLPRNLLMEATSFQVSQITLVNNSLLREAILDSVGNPIDMVAPIIVDLETVQVDTVVSRDIKFSTDYLVETQNKYDKTKMMNQIFYTIRNNERVVRYVGRLNNYLVGPDYLPVFELGSKKVEIIDGDTDLANDLTEILMGRGDSGTSILELERQKNHGVLKLASVRDDPSARGILRDYRYHGIGRDASGNPIFADDVPFMAGGFGMQVARMISSGLVNKQNDVYVISNRDEIVDSIRHPTKEIDSTQYDKTQLQGNSAEDKYVSRVSHYIDNKLKSKLGDGTFEVTQYLLEQLYLKDPLRFKINEVARRETNDNEINANFTMNDEILYMIPLIEEDTFSLASVVTGTINDPYEDSQSKLTSVLQTVNEKLKDNFGSTNSSELTTSSISLTGNPVTSDGSKQDVSGIFINSNNLFYFPEFGPYQKYLVDNYDISNGIVYDAKKAGDSGILVEMHATDIMELHNISIIMKERLGDTNGILYDLSLNEGTIKKSNQTLKNKFNELYRRFRERSFHIRYILTDNYNTLNYEAISDDQNGRIVFNDSNNAMFPSAILGYSNVRPTLTWRSKTMTDSNTSITQYDKLEIGSDGSSGVKSVRMKLIDLAHRKYDFKPSYDLSNAMLPYNLISKYIEVLNDNPYTNVRLTDDVYFKVNVEVPVTNMSSEEFVSIAKYEKDGALGPKYNNDIPTLHVIEHKYDMWSALERSNLNNMLRNPAEDIISSNKRNIFEMLSINDDIEGIFTNETFIFNMLDLFITGLFYKQLTTYSKQQIGLKQIGENEFFNSIESVVSTLAHESIFLPMELIKYKVEAKKAEFVTNGQTLFPISLSNYVDLLKEIVYSSDTYLAYIQKIKKHYLLNSKVNEQRDISSGLLTLEEVEFLDAEETELNSRMETALKISPQPSPPFDVMFYKKAFENDMDYPAWRIGNIPESLRRVLDLSIERLISINENDLRDLVHMLWRVDFIWNLKDTSGNQEAFGWTNPDDDEVFKQFFDEYEPRKTMTTVNNELVTFETYKEAFLNALFDVTFLPGVMEPRIITIQQQNQIYQEMKTNPKQGGNIVVGDASRSNSEYKFMWKTNLDVLFSNEWRWPFTMHVVDYAPKKVLSYEYNDIIRKLTDIEAASFQYVEISSNEILDLKTKLDAITSDANYTTYETAFTEADRYNEDGNGNVEQGSINFLRECDYDGYFYNNKVVIKILEYYFNSSGSSILQDNEYTEQRTEMITSLTNILDNWLQGET